MQDRDIDRSPTSPPGASETSRTGAAREGKARMPHRRERQTWRLVIGLTGLLGVAWAVAIASRYPNILPG